MDIEQNKYNGGFCTFFQHEGNFYYADLACTSDKGNECMIFPANEDKKITDWQEVYVNHNVNITKEDLERCVKEFCEVKKMSLTDDWKAGKLPEGNYFCKTALGCTDIFNCKDNCFFTFAMDDQVFYVEEVLAPVPSYEKFISMKEDNADKIIRNVNVRLLSREVENLRELLKECCRAFETYAKEDETCGLEEDEEVKTPKEIELEKKLEIAIKALKKIELLKNIKLSDKAKIDLSFKLPREALAKIKEIK